MIFFSSQQRVMWDWMRHDVPARTPYEEQGGLHAEQTHRGAVSVTIEAAWERRYCTPMNSKIERAGMTT